jgi:tetratricopeptide (TPR) repeat protein
MVRFVMAAAFSFVLAGSPSAAQAPDDSAPPAPDAPPVTEAPPKDEGLAADRANPVDELLGRLSKTEDQRAAKRIAAAVQALWIRSGSDTVDLLTTRAGEAQRAQKLDIAIKLMDEAIGLRPDFTEGWNRRATLHFLAKDYDEAMSDLHEVLIREPRHFGAWVGLGRILADAGFEARALAAYRKALEIYPAIEGLKKQVDELTLKVEGQPI